MVSEKKDRSLSRRDFLKAAVTGGTAVALSACQLRERFDLIIPPPEGTKTNPTATVPPREFTPAPVISSTPSETLAPTPEATATEVLYYETSREELVRNIQVYYDGELELEDVSLYRDGQGKIVPLNYYNLFDVEHETDIEHVMDSLGILLGIYRQGDRQILVIGSVNTNNERIVWGAISGYLNKQDYFSLWGQSIELQTGSYPSTNPHRASPFVVDQDLLSRYLKSLINKPIMFTMTISTTQLSPNPYCGKLYPNECELWWASNRNSGVPFLEWKRGTQSEIPYAIAGETDLQRVGNMIGLPLLNGISVKLPAR